MRGRSRRQQRVGAEGEQKYAEHHFQDAGIGMRKQMHADRNADEAADHERPEFAEIQLRRCGQIVVVCSRTPQPVTRMRRMQRIDAMQPDRGGREREGKAAAAGSDAAKQRAEPEQAKSVERQAGHHGVSPD